MPFVYVANALEGTISVIDTVTNSETARVSVGGEPVSIAVSPAGRRVYVAPPISVIDATTNSVIATIPVVGGVVPWQALAVHPDGTRVYAATYGGTWNGYALGNIRVIDAITNMVTSTIPLGGAQQSVVPLAVVINPAGTQLYVSVDVGSVPGQPPQSSAILIIDVASQAVVATIPGSDLQPLAALGMAFSPDGTKLYAVGGLVSVIDTRLNAVVATTLQQNNAGLQVAPFGVAVAPDGMRVYVPSGPPCGEVLVLDAVTNTFVTRVPLGPTPADRSTQARGMVVHPDGTRLYVADAQYTADGSGAGGTLVVVDTATNSVRNVVPLGNTPTGVAIGPACLKNADCDDPNPCTDDRCDRGRCVHAANTAPCDDGNGCTTTDHCLNGSCVGGPPLDCDDGNPCTADTCSAAGGCIHTPMLSCALTTTTSTIPRPTTTTVLDVTTTTTTVPCGTARCTLDAALQSPGCAGQAVPRNITKKLDQATRLIEQARSSGAKKAKRLLEHAKTTLNLAVKAAERAAKGRQPKLTAACAASIERAADGVRGGLGV